MQLFSRQILMVGPPAETMAYAVDMRAHVSKLTGREFGLWQAMFGAPVGTVGYTARVEGLADFSATSAKVLGDATYMAKVTEGQKYSGGPAVDSLMQPIHGEIGDQVPPVGCIATVTTARMADGHQVEATAWGVDMAEYVESVTGVPLVFGSSMYGAFGEVGWIGVTPDEAAMDAVNTALSADEGYIKRLEGAAGLFVPDSAHRMVSRRIA